MSACQLDTLTMTEVGPQRRDALSTGTVLRDYTLESVIGHGGFGIVYRARHDELGLTVAVKEYLPVELAIREGSAVRPRSGSVSRDFEDGLRRFRDEARALIAVRNHASIVSCRDFFRANGTAYLVMEHEDGVPLDKLLASREAEGEPFGERDLLAVMVPLVQGLAIVHEAGILHRDIKPSNILIRSGKEQPVLIDFGAAKHVVAKHSKSLAPYTEGYAALEQVADAGDLGPWTDMYGVGALMWRIVAGGQRPWEPPNPLSVERRSHAALGGQRDPLPPARELGKGRFKPSLLSAIDRCLRLPEAERVQGCGELLDVLRSRQANRAGGAESAATARSPRRKTWRVATIALVASIALTLAVPRWWDTAIDSRPEEARGPDTSSSRSNSKVDSATPEVSEPNLSDPVHEAKAPSPTPDSQHRNDLSESVDASEETNLDGDPSNETESPDSDARPQSPDSTTGVLDQLEPEVETADSAEESAPRRGPGKRNLEVESSRDSEVTVPVGSPGDSPQPERAERPTGSTTDASPDVRKQRASELPNLSQLAPYWTMGSHEDDVLRLQGTPRSIMKIGKTERWRYGSSSVKIDARTRRVLEWSDPSGKLEVELRPGREGAGVRFWTMGTHEDDVLRLQGTPRSITKIGNTERWRYGSSSVKIDARTRRVLEWSDPSGEFKVRMHRGGE